MATAATMSIAAAIAAQNVEARDPSRSGASLRTPLTAWLAAMESTIATKEINQRTVLNWIPVGRVLYDNLPGASDQSVLDINNVAMFLYRSCRAIEFATTAGRITSAEATALLTSYNTIWA